jgi:hypothetical protein
MDGSQKNPITNTFDDTSSRESNASVYMVREDPFKLQMKERKSLVVSSMKSNVAVKKRYEMKKAEATRKVEEWAPTVISASRPEKARNKPLVKGFCEGMDTPLFLDSGAEVNVVDLEYFRKLQKFADYKIRLYPKDGSISCANGTKMRTYGSTELKVKVGQTMANLHFIVAANLFPRVIIGIRGLKTLNVKLDPANSCAIAGERDIPFISQVAAQSVWSENGKKSALGVGSRLEEVERLH